jgi:hypothetical protein
MKTPDTTTMTKKQKILFTIGMIWLAPTIAMLASFGIMGLIQGNLTENLIIVVKSSIVLAAATALFIPIYFYLLENNTKKPLIIKGVN